MTKPGRPQGERRKHGRYSPENIRVRVGSGEFEEKYTAVNFATRLLNLGMKGMCIQTAGRLRADVKMIAEVRFDDLAATLRSEARVVWVHTDTQGAVEAHKAGLEFVGDVQISKPIREYLQGADRELIRARREGEYAQLRRNAEARKEGGGRKWGPVRKLVVAALVLVLLYAGSFWGFVLVGRRDSPEPGFTYSYLPPNSKKTEVEAALARIYGPAYWFFRKVGVALHYRPPAS